VAGVVRAVVALSNLLVMAPMVIEKEGGDSTRPGVVDDDTDGGIYGVSLPVGGEGENGKESSFIGDTSE